MVIDRKLDERSEEDLKAERKAYLLDFLRVTKAMSISEDHDSTSEAYIQMIAERENIVDQIKLSLEALPLSPEEVPELQQLVKEIVESNHVTAKKAEELVRFYKIGLKDINQGRMARDAYNQLNFQEGARIIDKRN